MVPYQQCIDIVPESSPNGPAAQVLGPASFAQLRSTTDRSQGDEPHRRLEKATWSLEKMAAGGRKQIVERVYAHIPT